MITVGMNYHVAEGKKDKFVKRFAQVLDAMQEAPGHKKTQLYENVFSEGVFLVVSEWDDREEFARFTASEAFAKVTRWGREGILRERPRHEIYESSPVKTPSGKVSAQAS